MKELLQELVTQQAEFRPEATALVFHDEQLSYAQLEQTSNQLSRLLKSLGCGQGDRVCFLMPKSPAAILSILGTLKADCVYVPLDAASPAPRLARIIESCEPRAILAAGPVAHLLDELLMDEKLRAAIRIGWLESPPVKGEHFRAEFTLADLRTFSAEPLDSAADPEDPAHILFTSGSTGLPKGVVIKHSNVLHFIRWAVPYFRIQPGDHNSSHPPLHFDLSTFDLFGTFLAGAELHLVPAELNLVAGKLAQFIRSHQLTQWFSVPSTLNFMAKFDVVRPGDFPTLKRVLWCGEVLPTAALKYWMERLPHVTFTNLYGPTETTIASSFYTVPQCPEDETTPIPIGTACPGEELLVLDEELLPVMPGDIGDLYIRGVGLSPGYWRDAEKTRAAFLSYPQGSHPDERIYKTGDLARVGPDGLVYFQGRKDSQIKSRGYRIELGEIEAALSSLPQLAESAVVAIEVDGFEGKAICCAYVSAPHVEATPADLHKKLSRLLPGYMLPARWLAVDRLPRNANGKVDRRKLADEFLHRENQAVSA